MTPEDYFRRHMTFSQDTIIRYGKKINVYFPEYEAVEKMVTEKGPLSFYQSVENRKECCGIRKIVPLKQGSERNGMLDFRNRADQSDNRSQMDWLEYDEKKKLFKFYPLFNWSFDDVKRFVKENNIPYNSFTR